MTDQPNITSRAQTPRRMSPIIRLMCSLALVSLLLAVGLSACGGSEDTLKDTLEPAAASETETAETSETGIRLMEPSRASELLNGDTGQPILLDVRTPEEFDEGHLDGAILIDFYEDDFKEALAELDRDAPYVIYCRSGNRSGQTREFMAELGFADVVDIDGGIIAWEGDGLPTVG